MSVQQLSVDVDSGPLSTTDRFKAVFRSHPAGVAVVTADIGSGPVGLTATSVASVSADPPLLIFSVSDQSSSSPVIRQADSVVVHLLGADQLEIAQLCATSGIDRFADTSLWDSLATGEPYFPSAHSWIRGHVVDRMRAGTGTVLLVHAAEAKVNGASASVPLVYHDRRWHGLHDGSVIA